jgi:hypothetical protein
VLDIVTDPDFQEFISEIVSQIHEHLKADGFFNHNVKLGRAVELKPKYTEGLMRLPAMQEAIPQILREARKRKKFTFTIHDKTIDTANLQYKNVERELKAQGYALNDV